MTHCPGDSSGPDHSSSLAASFSGGQRAGQGSQGSGWEGQGPGGLSEEGVGTPGGEPWPGAGQGLGGLQEPRRWISWGGVYTARGWTGDIFLR